MPIRDGLKIKGKTEELSIRRSQDKTETDPKPKPRRHRKRLGLGTQSEQLHDQSIPIEEPLDPNVVTLYHSTTQQSQQVDVRTLGRTNVSFHFLLATTGRSSISLMLDSLIPQLKFQDYLTIVIDGLVNAKKFETELGQTLDQWVADLKQRTVATIQVSIEVEPLGYWGHGIRNKYRHLPGDFILHCDDDDIYTPKCLEVLRRICTHKNTLYIYKVQTNQGIVPKHPTIEYANISTQCGVIPAPLNGKGYWEQRYGGDCDFYQSLLAYEPPIVFVDYLIYVMRPS
jgi:hypothetical protein